MKEQVSITIDEKLLSKVDRLRGLIPRSTFIEHELEGVLKDAKQ